MRSPHNVKEIILMNKKKFLMDFFVCNVLWTFTSFYNFFISSGYWPSFYP